MDTAGRPTPSRRDSAVLVPSNSFINFWGSALTISGDVGGDVTATVGNSESRNAASNIETLLFPLQFDVELRNPGLILTESGAIDGQLEYTGPTEGIIRGETALCYMEKGSERKVLQHSHRGGFVLTPMDRLFYYLSERVREIFGMGSCYLVINNADIIAVFRCRKKGKKLIIQEYYGDVEGVNISVDWARRVDIEIEWEMEEIDGKSMEDLLR